ncbi:hypothetical protein WJX74_003163 [Apatococcus lobatus]|uniref:Uncharacterized protein n=1 Tax=Apatococcus lobatus TaxID=904363 RepID=A0AAW1RPL9_9CHLO
MASTITPPKVADLQCKAKARLVAQGPAASAESDQGTDMLQMRALVNENLQEGACFTLIAGVRAVHICSLGCAGPVAAPAFLPLCNRVLGQLSYRQLVEEAAQIISQRVQNQHPTLEVNQQQDMTLMFLQPGPSGQSMGGFAGDGYPNQGFPSPKPPWDQPQAPVDCQSGVFPQGGGFGQPPGEVRMESYAGQDFGAQPMGGGGGFMPRQQGCGGGPQQ